jgi:hypothetical protein
MDLPTRVPSHVDASWVAPRPTFLRTQDRGTVSLSVQMAARGASQPKQGSRRTLSGRWLQSPKAVSKWRLEPFAPFDTALWAYSGCSLRPSTDLYALPRQRYGISFGGVGGEGSLAAQARLKTHPSIRPFGPTQDAHSGLPPTCIHCQDRGTVSLSVEMAARGASQPKQGSRRTLSGRWLQSPKAVSKWRLESFAPVDTALWAYSGCALRLSTDLCTLPKTGACLLRRPGCVIMHC